VAHIQLPTFPQLETACMEHYTVTTGRSPDDTQLADKDSL
jgi:hypothetical protein